MFQVMSVLPFSAKNAFVTAYLLESSLARFKNFVCSLQTLSSLLSLKEGNQWISLPLVDFLPYGKEQEVHKCIHPKHFRVSGIKISNVVTKETSQMLLQTLWYLEKLQKKFSQSLRGRIHRCRI